MYSPNKEYHLTELLKRADAGDLDSMSELVSLLAAEEYLIDPEEQEIQERYIACLETLAASGDVEACIMLGDAYKDGTGVRQDPLAAIEWFARAVERGEPFGNECIGMMYYSENGIPQDYQKAFAYFTKTDERKSFCTLYALGEMYRCGHYVDRNESKACAYYREIVCTDKQYAPMDDYYWRACYRLACAYHYATGIERDLELALIILKTAQELRSEGSDDAVSDIPDEEFLREWTRLNQDLEIV